MFSKILKYLFILQIISNKERQNQGLKKLGRGYYEAYRINPYNPLSYIVLIIILIGGVLAFGFIGIWKEIATRNPFKWD